MPAFVCVRCGLQYAPTATPPDFCVLCVDNRLSVAPGGQAWTTIPDLKADRFSVFRRLEPKLMGIGTVPAVGLGQRALLVRTPQGNILWDCTSFLDESTVTIIGALGGVSAIAASTPHAHGALMEWSQAFGGVPIYLHAADRKFGARYESGIMYWEDDRFEIVEGVTLLRCGGPFMGATAMHWASGGGGIGALLAGTSLRVGPDKRVSFLRSAENRVPLDAGTAQRMGDILLSMPFDSLYGGWWYEAVPRDARNALVQSLQRHIDAVSVPPLG